MRALSCQVILAALGLGLLSCGSEPGESTRTSGFVEGTPAQAATAERTGSADKTRATARPAGPNVVWILLDACRAQNLSCYGYERKTSPRIDALAEEGVLFEQHFSQASATVASVPSYFTGRYFPVSCLTRGSWRELGKVPPSSEKLVSNVLGTAGYATLLVSCHPFLTENSRLWQSFDEQVFVAPTEGNAYAKLEELEPHIRGMVERQGQRPFFLYVHTLDTHRPHYHHALRPDWFPDADFAHAPERPFSEEDRQWLRGEYDTSIVYADEQVGRILDFFEAAGLADRTVFVIGSDHGELLGEDGKTLNHPVAGHFDELYHVPLVLKGPGLPKGVRVGALTENTDIAATLYELLGLSPNVVMNGKSLMPLISPAAAPVFREHLFAKKAFEPPHFILRDESLKYVVDTALSRQCLFAVPDHAPESVPVLARHPEQALAFKEQAASRYLPLYEDYVLLPADAPAMFWQNLVPELIDSSSQPVVRGKGRTEDDDLWDYSEGQLVSHPWREDAPPITLSFDVPNGTFAVDVEVRGQASKGGGSAILMKAEDDAGFHRVPSPDEAARLAAQPGIWQWARVGTYEITDERFEATIDEGDPEQPAALKGFRFVAMKPGEDAEDLPPDTQDNQLRALGYLD